MFKYCIAFALSIITFASYSEPSNMAVSCVTAKELEQVLFKWKELPLARGNSIRPDGQQQTLVIFINPQTQTWTITEKQEGDLYCILAGGDNFGPVPQEVIESFKKMIEGI